MEEVKLDVRLRKTKPRVPGVLTRAELMGLLDRLDGQHRLAAELQYGGGQAPCNLGTLRLVPVK